MKLEKLLANKKYRQIAVIGSHKCIKSWNAVAFRVGGRIAEHNKILLTGGCNGLPGKTKVGALKGQSIVVEIRPESEKSKNDPEIQINTGFGFKGRNVILIRSSDLVLILPGGLGTINELTIALDENRPCYLVNKKLDCEKITKSTFVECIAKILAK